MPQEVVNWIVCTIPWAFLHVYKSHYTCFNGMCRIILLCKSLLCNLKLCVLVISSIHFVNVPSASELFLVLVYSIPITTAKTKAWGLWDDALLIWLDCSYSLDPTTLIPFTSDFLAFVQCIPQTRLGQLI